MAQNWNMDPEKRDYVMSGGAPEQTDSLLIPAYIRLKTPRQNWMYAPNATYGSNFYKIKKNNTTDNASLVETTAAEALQPIADDGRASSIDVTTTVATRNAVGLETKIVDAAGKVERVVFKSLGV